MDDYTGLIHVDSNVIDDRCSNTQSSFVNYTTSNYRYSDDKFEVGLLELHLPYSWNNLSEGSFIGVFSGNRLIENGLIPIRGGCYNTVDSLIATCNKAMRTYFFGARFPLAGSESTFYFDSDLRRVVAPVVLGQNEKAKAAGDSSFNVETLEVRFTSELAFLFGFDDRCFEVYFYKENADLERRNGLIQKVLSQRPDMKIEKVAGFPIVDATDGIAKRCSIIFFRSYDQSTSLASALAAREHRVYHGIEELFVYCSIIKHQMIGNSFKQILRVTPVFPAKHWDRGQPVVLAYDRPYYFSLFDTSFDKIEIQLRDRAGKLIEFESGSTIAILEIRRKKHGE